MRSKRKAAHSIQESPNPSWLIHTQCPIGFEGLYTRGRIIMKANFLNVHWRLSVGAGQ